MAAEDLSLVLSAPGRLCYNPTQAGLLQAFPHGGTALGLVSDVAVERDEVLEPVVAWEFGQEINSGFRSLERWALAFVLRQWDPDTLGLLFRTTTTSAGGYSGAKTLKASTIGQVGALSPILFSPLDVKHPAVLIYAPMPARKATQILALSLDRRLEVAAVFRATRGTVGEPIAIDRLEHLSLT